MGKSGMKSYTVNGVKKDFDFEFFRKAVDAKTKHTRSPREGAEKSARRRLTKSKLEEELSLATGADITSVHNWLICRNAPRSLEIVGKIAEYFGIEMTDLLIDNKEDSMGTKLTDSQREAVARVYREIEDYLYLYEKADRFVWKDYRVMVGGPYAKYVPPYIDQSAWVERDAKRLHGYLSDENLQLMIYRATRGYVFDEGADLAEAGHDWVCHALEREWVELGGHPIYEELKSYIYDALIDLWNDKTDPDYWYEPIEEDLYKWSDSDILYPAKIAKTVQEMIQKYL